ncbi:hypothetical protein GCM10010392_49940 [Streptomyces clavifer]|uniref:Secreted protein n=1 Tax=Streptomyces clavifer TaxID=68188 RepID=A0ABS4V7S3_9ACTN|nr:hypothetical protein [Streptomyces clavifer]GHB15805.1 hypothetical protein GCM10010392_49940 [Streptomyces clavifer]
MRFGIAGWPALAFLGGTLLAHTETPVEERTPVPAVPTADPSAPELVTEEQAPELGPAPIPAAEESPVLPPADASPPVPAALVDHARKVADDHRARTGSPIDTDTLRARLGVPPQLAAAIAAQLA